MNLRVEEIFREIFMVFELKIFSSLHLESFDGFLDFLNFRHIQNKYKNSLFGDHKTYLKQENSKSMTFRQA